MKKSFVTILALCTMDVSVSAQVFIIDSSANTRDGSSPSSTSGGLVWLDPDGNSADATVDTTQDISLGVLWGTSSSSVTTPLNIDPFGLNLGAAAGSGNWLADQRTGMEDITLYASGAILDPNGILYQPPGVAIGTTIWLVLQGWTGTSITYANALVDGGLRGQTAPFSVTLTFNTNPNLPDTRAMSALVLVPEPSTLALSGVGAAALMLVRRKKITFSFKSRKYPATAVQGLAPQVTEV